MIKEKILILHIILYLFVVLLSICLFIVLLEYIPINSPAWVLIMLYGLLCMEFGFIKTTLDHKKDVIKEEDEG